MQNDTKTRYGFIDAIRGAAVLVMIIGHAIWNAQYTFGIEPPIRYDGAFAGAVQFLTITLFISVSGYSWSLGRRPAMRGIMALLGGGAVTLVTYIISSESYIICGVLTFIGSAVLLMIPLSKPLSRVSPTLGIIISAALFALSYSVPDGYVGFFRIPLVRLPDALYDWGLFSAYIGFTPPGFSSLDYFPLFPWVFVFVFGFFLYRLVHPALRERTFYRRGVPVLGFFGRHALIVYLLHQPVLYIISYAIMLLV